jgi:hypothetical protein
MSLVARLALALAVALRRFVDDGGGEVDELFAWAGRPVLATQVPVSSSA